MHVKKKKLNSSVSRLCLQVEAQHWACYVGCRTTCLLQVGAAIGQQKYDYESAKKLCVQGNFKLKP